MPDQLNERGSNARTEEDERTLEAMRLKPGEWLLVAICRHCRCIFAVTR